ncbi:hypothetical protein SAY87_009502 [Trapa incisa]|uniref:XS domain-containing protein n=1 Tax=Trapa incisa TaxID=236973 RepID=A0AAN7JV31_9MYRT|nr:hypothetical protein SAY87_009502 [Trapa incisa]
MVGGSGSDHLRPSSNITKPTLPVSSYHRKSNQNPPPQKPLSHLPTDNKRHLDTKPSPAVRTVPKPFPIPRPPLVGPSSPLPSPLADLMAAIGPPPPPSYGFHMLDRRTIVLADGSVRSYFALPSDYQDFPARPFIPRPGLGAPQDYWSSLMLDSSRPGPSEAPGKRKFSDDMAVEALDWKRQQLSGPSKDGVELHRFSRNGNVRSKHLHVDQRALKRAFLYFVKAVNENPHRRKNYFENGRNGALRCLACKRSSKDFPDMHSLVLHTYSSESAESHVDHLGLHKALCALMGWNYAVPPDNSRAYQSLSATEAAANQEDLIMWPPTVIIHNTITGKGKEGRMEGLGIKAMDSYIRELGFLGGKSKSLYGREGHLGITLIKFAGSESGLREAMKLAEHFEKESHGRKGWARLQPLTLGENDDHNPNLVRVDGRTGEKRRIFYGFLGIAADLEKLDFDSRKKMSIESREDHLSS